MRHRRAIDAALAHTTIKAVSNPAIGKGFGSSNDNTVHVRVETHDAIRTYILMNID